MAGLQLFISYARVDKFEVHQLVDLLREGGHQPWFDHELTIGEDWQTGLLNAIRSSQAFVYAITPGSLESRWCQWEFNQAVSLKKRIIPVLIRKGGTLPPALNRIHYADFTDGISVTSAARLLADLNKFATEVTNFIPDVPAQPSGYPAQVRIPYDSISRHSVDNIGSLATLRGHEDAVQGLSFDRRSEFLASASWDRRVILWSVSGRYMVASFQDHFDAVHAVAFSPIHDLLVSASRDRTIKLWRTFKKFQAPLTLRGHESYVNSLSFSPDGEQMVSVSGSRLLDKDNSVRLWNFQNEPVIGRMIYTHDQPVNSVAFSPGNGTFLASASNDTTVRLNTMSRQRDFRLLTDHKHPVTAVTFSPDEQYLASGAKDGTIKLWYISTGQPFISFKAHRDNIPSLAFSPDGSLLASASKDRTIKIWDVPSGRELKTLEGHQDGVNAIAFSPDGSVLASASWDKTVKLWGLKKDKAREDTITRRVWSIKPRQINP
jgi:WD40 repeat protein